VTPAEFEELVRAALDELPPDLAAALENVAVVVAEEDPDDPTLFGVWEEDPYLPDRITIFRLPLERAFPARADLAREVRVTVLHELAHYFGIDEERLDELGYG
jgi:predicted Zn-dependent protease with MMP-like domain